MKKIWDHIGIIMSCTCIVHCLLLPVLVFAMQFDFHVDGFHEMMIAMTILISGHALWHGYKIHCDHIVIVYGGIGILCMIVALFGSETFEVAFTVAGAIMVLLAHILNLKKPKCCQGVD